jgi:hypothetical protein
LRPLDGPVQIFNENLTPCIRSATPLAETPIVSEPIVGLSSAARQLGNEQFGENAQGRCTGLPDNEFLLPIILPPDSSGIVAKLSEQLRRDQPRPGGRAGDVLPTRHAYGVVELSGRTPTVGPFDKPIDEWMDARICISYETRPHTYGGFARAPILPCRSV